MLAAWCRHSDLLRAVKVVAKFYLSSNSVAISLPCSGISMKWQTIVISVKPYDLSNIIPDLPSHLVSQALYTLFLY